MGIDGGDALVIRVLADATFKGYYLSISPYVEQLYKFSCKIKELSLEAPEDKMRFITYSRDGIHVAQGFSMKVLVTLEYSECSVKCKVKVLGISKIE